MYAQMQELCLDGIPSRSKTDGEHNMPIMQLTDNLIPSAKHKLYKVIPFATRILAINRLEYAIHL